MEQSLEQHLKELRKRVFRSLLAFVVASGAVFYFSSDILNWMQADLGFKLNALTAYEVFYTELMIALLGGFLLALPVIIYQLLKFVEPGLRENEYRAMRNYLPFSIALFLIGFWFSYNFIVKTSLNFFQSVTSSAEVTAVWGLQNTLGFALKLSAFTGIIFQLPIVAVVLGRAGIIDREMMIKYRNYFIVSILLAAAIATPPDLVTQVLVTAPVIGLYQLSIFLVGRIEVS